MSESLFERFRVGEFIRDNLLFVVIFLIGTVFLLVGIFQYFGDFSNDSVLEHSVKEKGDEEDIKIFVDVSGAVYVPGVYELSFGDRVQDAILASGGILEDADSEHIARELNMAREVVDGEKIYIPFFADDVLGAESIGEETDGRVNVNTASLSELDRLPRVGPVTAQKIIENRPYTSLEALLTDGVLGESTYNEIKDHIRIY